MPVPLYAYDVLQVQRPNGKGWQDYTTLRTPDELVLARTAVESGREPNGASAAFRVTRRGAVVLATGTCPECHDNGGAEWLRFHVCP